jgi:hypothetical protein
MPVPAEQSEKRRAQSDESMELSLTPIETRSAEINRLTHRLASMLAAE